MTYDLKKLTPTDNSEILEKQIKEMIFYFSSIKDEKLREDVLLFLKKINKTDEKADIFKIINNTKPEDLEYMKKFAKYINKTNSPAIKDKILDVAKTFLI